EDELRRQLIRFGGQGMGTLYDQWVLKPGELPIERQLAKVGLEIREQTRDASGRLGIIEERPDITAAQRKLLAGWLQTRASYDSAYLRTALWIEPRVSPTRDRPSAHRSVSEYPEMALIPAGDFLMGSSDGDDDEKQAHQVRLSAY